MGFLKKFSKHPKNSGVADDVAEHLNHILNTKTEYGAWQKGFGMRSFSSGKPRSDIIAQMIEDIRTNIELYEKRIKLVSVDVEDDLSLFNPRFRIQCKIGQKFHSFYIGFK